MQDTRPHNIVVCCDGSWCGEETDTRSNIKILADAFASEDPTNPVYVRAGQENARHNSKTNTDVCYFNGVGTAGAEGKELPGLLGGFFDLLVYCVNGAVATDLPERCKEAYRFIAEHYKGPDKSRIWLFGLSRGAYTVRAVAGMINNCGIVKKDWNGDASAEPKDVATGQDQGVGHTLDAGVGEDSQAGTPFERLVQTVWDMYSSESDVYHPEAPKSKDFRKTKAKVWPAGTKPPIVFMGLLDTVGATGLPRINSLSMIPLTYEYRPFRDFVVSSEVENVFQACSTHDRLAPFEPCPVRRREQNPEAAAEVGGQSQGQRHKERYPGVKLNTEEVWYPGAHYDLGRQQFVVSNQPLTHALNMLLNPFRTNVNFTPELADYPLLGYELDGTLNPPPSTSPTGEDLAKDYPPCIVGKVRCIAPNMLPAPSDRKVWKGLVKGPSDLSIVVNDIMSGRFISRIREEVQERGWKRAAVKETVDVASAVLGWGYTAFYGPKIVAKGLQFVGSYLPPPAFQPAYTIDAETKLLEQLAEFVGYVMTKKFTPDIILRDRSIPMPVDEDGFDIGEAIFFPVPRDGPNSFASYTPDGRKPKAWHMSKTYLTYHAQLAEWKARQSAGGRNAAPAKKQQGKAGGVDQMAMQAGA